jgi:2-polyprenyl-6-hydroxyphenyl methylase/3-demethylubiquinone-9 3-methyltransferase
MSDTARTLPGPAGAANVDAAELEKFQAIAANWWDPESEFAPLHRINPLRLGWIDRIAPLVGRKVLDVGCGGGILAESMALRGADVTGIDLAQASLQVAELHKLESGAPVAYRCVAVEDLAEEAPGRFDVVTCMEMLEHVPDPASVIGACAKLTRPGGHVFFSTINRNPKAFLFAIVGAEYLLRLLPRGTHQFDRFLKPSEIAAAARHHGLDPIETCGLVYNPITKIYSLAPDDVSVNYMMAFRRADDEGPRAP